MTATKAIRLVVLVLIALVARAPVSASEAGDPLEGEWLFAAVTGASSLIESIGAPDVDRIEFHADGTFRTSSVMGQFDATGTWSASDGTLTLEAPVSDGRTVLSYDYRLEDDDASLYLSTGRRPEMSLNGTRAEWLFRRPESFFDAEIEGRWKPDSDEQDEDMVLGPENRYSITDKPTWGFYRTWTSPSGKRYLTLVFAADIVAFVSFDYEKRDGDLYLKQRVPEGFPQQPEVRWFRAEDPPGPEPRPGPSPEPESPPVQFQR